MYLGGADDGAQIVSPADAEIAAHIQRIADAGDVGALPRSLGYETARESVVDAYVDATAAVAPAPEGAEGMTLGLHGDARRRVGDALAHPRGRRLPGPGARGGAARSRRRVPDRRVPEPRGAGRDGPRVRDRARARTPSS